MIDIQVLSRIIEFLINNQDISYSLERDVQLFCYKVTFVAFKTKKRIITEIKYEDTPINLTKKLISSLEQIVKI